MGILCGWTFQGVSANTPRSTPGIGVKHLGTLANASDVEGGGL